MFFKQMPRSRIWIDPSFFVWNIIGHPTSWHILILSKTWASGVWRAWRVEWQDAASGHSGRRMIGPYWTMLDPQVMDFSSTFGVSWLHLACDLFEIFQHIPTNLRPLCSNSLFLYSFACLKTGKVPLRMFQCHRAKKQKVTDVLFNSFDSRGDQKRTPFPYFHIFSMNFTFQKEIHGTPIPMVSYRSRLDVHHFLEHDRWALGGVAGAISNSDGVDGDIVWRCGVWETYASKVGVSEILGISKCRIGLAGSLNRENKWN